jgi:hypothetical protein
MIRHHDLVGYLAGDSVRHSVALPPGLDPKNLNVRATLYCQSIPPYYLRCASRKCRTGRARNGYSISPRIWI